MTPGLTGKIKLYAICGGNMVQITDIARDRIKEILEKESGKSLRRYIQGMGGGGQPRVGMALDEPKENEPTVAVNGIDVLVAEDTRPYVEGMVVDYVTNQFGEGFVIDGAGAC